MQKRNVSLDFYKGIAALGVIFVHIQFPGVFGNIMCSVGTCGVIFFFLISGYFAYGSGQEMCAKFIVRFKRNLRLLLIAAAAYFAVTAVQQLIHGTFESWISKFTDPVLYIRMIFLGDFEVIHGDPLWFMPALLYSYLVFWLIYRYGLQKLSYAAVPFFLLLRIGMETYTNTSGADWHLSGNAVVGALPIMLLGHYLAHIRDRLSRISDKAVIASCILSAAGMFLFVNVKAGSVDISQPFKIWCAASVFLWTIRKPSLSVSRPIETIGARWSLYVYLCHYPVIVILKDVCEWTEAPVWFISWCLPVIVAALSVAVAMLISMIADRPKAGAAK